MMAFQKAKGYAVKGDKEQKTAGMTR